jgi:hypothetical protein
VHEAFFEDADFTEPLVFPGFGEALFGVFGHRFQSSGLGGVDLQESAFNAGVLVDAGCGEGAVAGPQRDPAKQEMLFEFLPFIGRRTPEFMVRASLPATLRSYAYDLLRRFRFLHGRFTPWERAERLDVRALVEHMRVAPTANTLIRRPDSPAVFNPVTRKRGPGPVCQAVV